MKIYFVAGERSGDLHGGNLIRAFKKAGGDYAFRGFGGDEMEGAGMALVVHYRDLAFMGFVAVLANIFRIKKIFKLCQQDILTFQPDALVLIDYAGFNLRIAKFARERGIKVFWYIAPKVWAWNPGRTWKLKAYVDRLFSILPFEPDFFKRYDWEVDYVGNPVLDAVKAFQEDRAILDRLGLDPSKKKIALLPGSRHQEVLKILPLMVEVVKRNPSFSFIMTTVGNLPETLYDPIRSLPQVKLVKDAPYQVLKAADAAIVVSGTATLETALFKTPQVVVYRLGGLEYKILKRLVKVKYISLVNLIVDRELVREMIYKEANPDSVDAELKRLVSDEPYIEKIRKGYDELERLLDVGSASDNAARLMLQYGAFDQKGTSNYSVFKK